MQLQIATVNRHAILSTAKYIPNFSHENEKHLIADLSLIKCKCILVLEAEQQP